MIFVYSRHERHRFFGIGKLQNERLVAYSDGRRIVPYRFVNAFPSDLGNAGVACGIVYGYHGRVIFAYVDGKIGSGEIHSQSERRDHRFELEQVEQRVAAFFAFLRNEFKENVIVFERNGGVGGYHFVHRGERSGIPVVVAGERAHSVEEHPARQHVFNAEYTVVDIYLFGVGGIGYERKHDFAVDRELQREVDVVRRLPYLAFHGKHIAHLKGAGRVLAGDVADKYSHKRRNIVEFLALRAEFAVYLEHHRVGYAERLISGEFRFGRHFHGKSAVGYIVKSEIATQNFLSVAVKYGAYPFGGGVERELQHEIVRYPQSEDLVHERRIHAEKGRYIIRYVRRGRAEHFREEFGIHGYVEYSVFGAYFTQYDVELFVVVFGIVERGYLYAGSEHRDRVLDDIAELLRQIDVVEHRFGHSERFIIGDIA